MEGRELLTERQKEILNLIAQGYTDKCIASKLGVSTRTVQRQVADILARTDTDSRAHAVSASLISSFLS